MRSEAPYFFIYGQGDREVDPQFVHVERVSDRRPVHNGAVRDHSHPQLHQLSLWLRAEGAYRVGARRMPLSGPTLSWMPAGVVHGFDILPDSDAVVISLSRDFLDGVLRDLRLPQLQRLREGPIVHPLTSELVSSMRHGFEEVEREYAYPSWAQEAVVTSHVRLVLVALLRLSETSAAPPFGDRPASELFARFLREVDQRYREHWTVDDYATALATTPYLLNRASRQGAGIRASDVIRGRVIQEAKRMLLFTTVDVGAVGAALGFDDGSHFGRHFRKAVGSTPGAWRKSRNA